MRAVIAGPAKSEAGFTLIDLLFVIAIIGLLSTLALPGLMRAREAAHSASAIGTLRVVNSSQLSFAITCGLGFYAPDFPMLAVKPPAAIDAFLPAELAGGPTFIKGGYNFSMAGTPLAGSPATCNGFGPGSTAPGYATVADQLATGMPDGRFFGTNADGLIYEHSLSLGPTMPESGPPLVGSPIR